MFSRLAAIAAGLLSLSLLAGCSASGSAPPAIVVLGTPGPTPSPVVTPAPATPPPTPLPTRQPVLVSLSWLGHDVQVPGLPATFAPESPDPALQSVVEQAIAGAAGSVSVVVHNLTDGRSATVDESHVYYAASTYKMAVLYEAFRQVESGEQDLSRELTLDQKYADDDLGTMAQLGLHAGDSIKMADALKAMIVVSDTPTAALLQDTLGPARIDQTLRGLGINDTSFNDHNLPATAHDMARLLEAIAAGTGVSESSREAMMALLLQEEIGDGVIAGVPGGTAVAHKTGSYGNATHDIALVWGPAGPYVIAVMTDQPTNWSVISGLSAAVWHYFAAHQ